MKRRVLVLLVLVALLGSVTMAAAQNTGEIYGKVTDASGGVMPGVAVTLSSTVLLQPQTFITTETGTYRFPQLPIGLYSLKFELAGFKTVIKEGIRIEIGLSAQMNQALEISTLQETVTVSGETPLVDLKDTGKTNRFTQEALQSIPSARDPWVIIEQSAGVAMDRQNVGGSASGQQSNFVARGAAMSQQKWNLDGVDVTDMSATGGSPVYYDFDAFEEMQISTGGADVTMQSPGVGVNLVTKSGTDKFRGTGRAYITDEKFQSNNVDDALRLTGVNTGNPIQNILDYGIEAGGPIRKGRAWIWGSYGKQNIKVGINNFYLPSAECQAMKAAPLTYSLEDIRGCLSSDETLLNNYNAKLALQTFKNNQLSLYFNGAEKVRNARDASDLRPLETTYRQIGVADESLGSKWWKTGMPKTYKIGDRHIFSDRFMMEAQYAHVGNNFAITYHDDSLADVQPSFETTTGLWGRSYFSYIYVRPTDSIDITGNYFLAGVLGGDHAIKFGFKYRNDIATSVSDIGGDAYARFTNGVAREAQLYRASTTEYSLHNRSVYLQDSYSRKKMTVNVGLRFDYQNDGANPQQADAHQFFGKATYAGVYNGVTYPGAVFNQLPTLKFDGAESGVSFKDISPRVGITYDIMGNGRTVVKANYARYAGQQGTGNMSSVYNTLVFTTVRYPWVDVNGDKFIQANEVVMTAAPLAWTSGYSYTNPSQTTTTGTVDPNLKNEYTHELLVTFDKQVGTGFAVSASYIWRKYGNFRWNDRLNWSSDNYTSVSWTPAATACPVAGSRCETITYFQPTSQIPSAYILTNQPDYSRDFNGFEITARKRMSHRFSANASFSYNDAKVHYDSPAAYEDPTNIANLNGAQYAPESSSSGLGNVFVNAKWIFRASAVVQAPLGINLAAFYNARSGYPFLQAVQTPTRPFSAGQATVYLDPLGDNRLPNFQTIDFKIDRSFTLFNKVRVVPAIDVFNLMNGNTELSIRGTQNASNANSVSSILAPRVIRFGARIAW